MSQNSTTGIILPWEKKAIQGEEMPKGLEYPDQVLYQALALLYARFRLKTISEHQARREKLELLGQYRLYQFRDNLEKEQVEIIKATELARMEYRKNPTVENGMRLVEIIEGRKNLG